MIDNVDINKIQKELLEEDTIIDIAELFKVFADSTRVKIINVLLENGTTHGTLWTTANEKLEEHSPLFHIN